MEPLSVRRRLHRGLMTLALQSMLLTAGQSAHTAPAELPGLEYQVRAEFLVRFTRFIEWPASAFADGSSPITICVLGDDPFGEVLDQVIKGEQSNGRAIALLRLQRVPGPRTCQVIYTQNFDKEGLKSAPGVLTVGEGANFVRSGGVIGFVIDNRHVRFDINQKTAAEAQLNISSRLLSVARSMQRR